MPTRNEVVATLDALVANYDKRLDAEADKAAELAAERDAAVARAEQAEEAAETSEEENAVLVAFLLKLGYDPDNLPGSEPEEPGEPVTFEAVANGIRVRWPGGTPTRLTVDGRDEMHDYGAYDTAEHGGVPKQWLDAGEIVLLGRTTPGFTYTVGVWLDGDDGPVTGQVTHGDPGDPDDELLIDVGGGGES